MSRLSSLIVRVYSENALTRADGFAQLLFSASPGASANYYRNTTSSREHSVILVDAQQPSDVSFPRTIYMTYPDYVDVR